MVAVSGQQLLSEEVLQTVLVEAERIVNNRPLVPASADCPDQVALTPNDLLMLHNNQGLCVSGWPKTSLQQGWRQANMLASMFWKRWTREYLPTLQRRQKWWRVSRSLKTGDVVLLVDEQLSREQWPLGVVEEAKSDADGLVRTVSVRTKAGVVMRDVRKVCWLESDAED